MTTTTLDTTKQNQDKDKLEKLDKVLPDRPVTSSSAGLIEPVEPVLLADAGITTPKGASQLGNQIIRVIPGLNRIPLGSSTVQILTMDQAMRQKDAQVAGFIDNLESGKPHKPFVSDKFTARGTGTQPSSPAEFFNKLHSLTTQTPPMQAFYDDTNSKIVFMKEGKVIPGISIDLERSLEKKPDTQRAEYAKLISETDAAFEKLGVKAKPAAGETPGGRGRATETPVTEAPKPAPALAGQSFKDKSGAESFVLNPNASTGHQMLATYLGNHQADMRNLTATWTKGEKGGDVLRFEFGVLQTSGRVQTTSVDLNVDALLAPATSASTAGAFIGKVDPLFAKK